MVDTEWKARNSELRTGFLIIAFVINRIGGM